jgi:hypothetical protein
MGEARSEGFVLACAPPSAPAAAARLERLAPGRGPFRALLGAWLTAPRGCRWAVVAGTSTSLPELTASVGELLAGSPGRGDRIAARTGDEDRDRILAGVAPSLAALLGKLTDRQRAVAQLLLVERCRRAEIAAILGISRPTVSVMVDRAHLPEIETLVETLDTVATGD